MNPILAGIKPREPRVLVVEDEPRMRELLLQELPGMGFSPTGAPTAQAALRVLADGAVDIVLLDLNLPGMDGMSFLQKLRSTHPGVPVVILTAFGSLDAAKQAIRLGVTEFLSKPCHLGEIEVALDRARRGCVSPVPSPGPSGSETQALPTTLAQAEQRLISVALSRHNGNRSAAAAELGISRRTLYNKLRG